MLEMDEKVKDGHILSQLPFSESVSRFRLITVTIGKKNGEPREIQHSQGSN